MSPNSPLLKAGFLPKALLGVDKAFKGWIHVEEGEDFLRYVFDEDTETLTPFLFFLAALRKVILSFSRLPSKMCCCIPGPNDGRLKPLGCGPISEL